MVWGIYSRRSSDVQSVKFSETISVQYQTESTDQMAMIVKLQVFSLTH